MKKVFIFFFLLNLNFLFAFEIFYLEKEGKNERNKFLSLNIHLIAETNNGFFLIKYGDEKLGLSNVKKIGDFEEKLYFLTPRFEEIDLNTCGKILFKEENLYLVKIEDNSPCLKDKNFRVHKLTSEKLNFSKNFEEIEIEEDIFVKDMLENFDDELAKKEFEELVKNQESRYSTNAGCFEAVERAYQIFQEIGLEVEYQEYSHTFAPNLVGTLKGLIEPEKVIIVIGHIDDMPKNPPAPGANDNGSGSAMVINLAKILSNYRFSYTIKFLLVTGEEQGLVGSTYYSYRAKKEGEEIFAVLNADMIGWEGDGEPQEEDLDLSYDDGSENLAKIFMDVYNLYEKMIVPKLIYCPSNYYSDHYPFWESGYPAIMGITDNEGICHQKGSYPYYHTRRDTVQNCGNLDFFIKTQRSYLAVLAHIARPLCKILNEKNSNLIYFDWKYICPIKIKN